MRRCSGRRCRWWRLGPGAARHGGCCPRSGSRWLRRFAAGVAAEGTVAGDQGARAVLAGLSPLDRTVRVTWQGVVTPDVARRARGLLQPARARHADARWCCWTRCGSEGCLSAQRRSTHSRAGSRRRLRAGLAAAARRAARCSTRARRRSTALATPGARIRVVGATPLASAVPLGVQPGYRRRPAGANHGRRGRARPTAAVCPASTGRTAGSHSLAVGRPTQLAARGPSNTRLASSAAALASKRRRLQREGPFDGLDAARAQADAVPRRLLLAGGGAVAMLVLFVILAARRLRRDQLGELDRLRRAGASVDQCVLFVVAESAWISAVGAPARRRRRRARRGDRGGRRRRARWSGAHA